jgi:hypothetical protein
MSEENVAIVRAVYEAWNGPSGREDVAAFVADAFDEYAHELSEARDLGDRVLCFTTFVARTNADSVAIRQSEEQLWALRDGQIVRLQWFHDRAEALRAAGLSE